MRKSQKNKRGPKPETIKAEGVDWEQAIDHALHKPKPKGGWPKPEKRSKQK